MIVLGWQTRALQNLHLPLASPAPHDTPVTSQGTINQERNLGSQEEDPGYSLLREKVVAGSKDELGVCRCSYTIPDVMFPAERMEFLETSNLNLSLSFQKEINKIQDYQQRLDSYLENIRNLARKVESCDKEGASYNQLDFEMLKLEISELESMVIQLKSSITGSNEKLEALYMEVYNISVMVSQLERHDKNNVLKVRREITSLQKRLEECKLSHQSPFSMPFGTCEHGRIMNVSKSQVVQVNWRGISYKIGGWGKESFFGSTQELYWVVSSDSNSYYSNVQFYRTYKDLKNYKSFQVQTSISGRGNGLNIYNNSLYYHCHNRDICKLNLNTSLINRKTLPDLATRFSYAGSLYQDVDLEGDEYGLWILYSMESSLGNMVIGLLNTTSLDLIRTWTTSVYKPSVTNAFMVCGVMYATRTLNTREEEIFYMYDTNTGEEHDLKIPFDKMLENIHSLSYNANDRKLYIYNDGFELIYNLQFAPLAHGKS